MATEMGRTLERCFKESRAVDTESLCIIAGEKVGSILILEQGVRILFSMQVWSVRIDLHVLDHCGNIIDCAAIAAITALKYFRLYPLLLPNSFPSSFPPLPSLLFLLLLPSFFLSPPPPSSFSPSFSPPPPPYTLPLSFSPSLPLLSSPSLLLMILPTHTDVQM